MENDSFLKIRVSSELKGRFESACAVLGQPASVVLRGVVVEWLRENGSLGEDDIQVAIFKPDEEYEPGAWQVSIGLMKLPPGTDADVAIPFALPQLPSRHILSDQGFRAIVLVDGIASIGGQLVNGVWRGHMYTSGCMESVNPTSLATARAAFKAAVLDTVRRFDA